MDFLSREINKKKIKREFFFSQMDRIRMKIEQFPIEISVCIVITFAYRFPRFECALMEARPILSAKKAGMVFLKAEKPVFRSAIYGWTTLFGYCYPCTCFHFNNNDVYDRDNAITSNGDSKHACMEMKVDKIFVGIFPGARSVFVCVCAAQRIFTWLQHRYAHNSVHWSQQMVSYVTGQSSYVHDHILALLIN